MRRRLCFLFIFVLLGGCGESAWHGEIVLRTYRQGLILPSLHTYTISIDKPNLSSVRLPVNPGDYPEWSPDGEWIAFQSRVYGSMLTDFENAAVYVSKSSGGTRKRVTAKRGFLQPSWAPDGTRIAVCHDDYIYLVSVECVLNAHPCVSDPTLLVAGYSPDWSPTGDKIVYLSPDRHISVINVDRAAEPIILAPDLYAGEPKWSPSGDKIAFGADVGEHADVFVINADGSGLTNLTNGEGSSDMPRWSPDGTKIAFISNREDFGKTIGPDLSSTGLYLMNPDGTDVSRISQRDDEGVLWFAWIRP